MRRILVGVALLVIAGAAAILYSQFRADIAAARALVEGRSKTVETGFGTVEYAEEGTGAPLLVIHGAGGGFDQALDEAGVWAAGHRIIAPSRFGYLRSSFPQGATSAMQADAFVALLDSLGVQKAAVLGISAGANSAMEMAMRHPDRVTALVLLVPAAYAPSRQPPSPGGSTSESIIRTVLGSDFIFWAGTRFFPDLMAGTILATDPALVRNASPADQERAGILMRHILPVSLRTEGLIFDGMMVSNLTTSPALEKIACPVLAISARDDRYGTAETADYVASHVANGRAVIFDTGGHVMIGHNDEVLRLIGDFIDGN